MKIVVKKVGQHPEVKEINCELHEMQEIVGGYIEFFIVYGNLICVCNEEGKLEGLAPNFIFNSDMICGDVFFCSYGEEDFESLNDDQVKYVMNLMRSNYLWN